MSLPDAVFDLKDRARFHLTGADRVRYLNGQCTNDIRHAESGRTKYALITDHKAHITADFFVHVMGETLVLDVEPALREVVAARLERYIIADDVTLTDATDEWSLFHVTGGRMGEFSGVVSNRLGEDGLDVWLPAGQSLFATGHDFEGFRVAAGVPRYPNELNNEMFPADVGLEQRAVSFNKGCYIGQEVISRTQSTGKHPREMVRLVGLGLVEGMELILEASPEAAVGRVTSASGDHALGWVKQGALREDSRLLARGEAPTLAVPVSLVPSES
ncbi:MAG: folate-binding protein YgfZ [Verrucomicrobiaceae bacterium]|nr:folate-binding protein YgfZ [Verrucomicrobiaceae bacterium]